ncbi:MAG: DUF4097 family beta strand repeat-containing protein [Saprospiraceae bacterium]
MKNLINKITGIGLILFLTFSVSAQDYKVKMSSGGKVIINKVNKVDIVGHNGTEVIIQGEVRNKKKDTRASGLRVISGDGTVDNTGLGLSAVKEGNELTIEQVVKNSKGRFTIKIPQGVAVLYEHSTHHGEDLNIKDISGEIEVSAHFNHVKLENVTGPMSINTVHGHIEAVFANVNQSNPSTIRSSHGWIDVTLPSSTKANLKLKSSHGDMFTDFEINRNIKTGKSTKNDKDSDGCGGCGNDNSSMSGGINGGGVLIDLYTAHANIYLRKKK